MKKILAELDRNNDGVINASELLNMLDGVVKARVERRYMWFAITALSIFALCTIGAVVGLTYAVVDALKDTQVQGGTMYVKGSDTEVVRTGSAELAVVNGIVMSRDALASNATNATLPATNVGLDGSTALPSTQAVLKTASFLGTPQPFSSRIDVRTLMELKYLYIKGAGSVEVALVVAGVARVPAKNSVWGTVVRIATVVGTVTLDDVAISFSQSIADVFTEAGFTIAGTSSNRRMLIGVYDVMGFFNFIENLPIENFAEGQIRPKLPSADYLMRLKISEPCVSPTDPSATDRCLVGLPPADYFTASQPALASDAPEYPPAASVPPAPALGLPPLSPGESQPPFAPTAVPVDSSSPAPTVDPTSDLRRRRVLRSQRSLQDSLNYESFVLEDLAGTEVIDGVRYMTHYESVTVWQNRSRTSTHHAIIPAYRKLEVLLPSGMVHAWQEEVLPSEDGKTPARTAARLYCKSYPLPPTLVSRAALGPNAVVNFTFEGYDTLGDRAARHFRLTIKQPVDASLGLNVPSTVTVDYWDSLNDNTPLAFEFNHPTTGRVLLQVVEFTALHNGDLGTDPALYVPPDATECSTINTVPQLASPFRAANAFYTEPSSAPGEASTRRRMAAVRIGGQEGGAADEALAPQHPNTTERHVPGLSAEPHYLQGEWPPQWAADFYIPPARSGAAEGWAARRELQSCTGWQNTLTIPLLDCEYSQSSLGGGRFSQFSLGCGGDIKRSGASNTAAAAKVSLLSWSGKVTADTCAKQVAGCITLTASLGNLAPKGFVRDVLNTIGPKIEGEGCIGYDWGEGVGFFSFTLTVDLNVFKVELSVPTKFSQCCFWIEEVTLEAFVGINLWFWSGYWSIGDLTIAEDVFIRGSRQQLQQMENPTLNNVGAYITVPPAYQITGTSKDAISYPSWAVAKWQPIVRCREKIPGATTVRGRPMYKFRLQIEEWRSGNDNTGMNGIQVECSDPSGVVADTIPSYEGDWGSWTSWVQCPGGQSDYIVGAEVRYDDFLNTYYDGGLRRYVSKDNTMLNSVRFKCRNGAEITPYEGVKGAWRGMYTCAPRSFVCGFYVGRQFSQGSSGDDFALAGFQIVCCREDPPASPPALYNLVSTLTVKNKLPDSLWSYKDFDSWNDIMACRAPYQRTDYDWGFPISQLRVRLHYTPYAVDMVARQSTGGTWDRLSNNGMDDASGINGIGIKCQNNLVFEQSPGKWGDWSYDTVCSDYTGTKQNYIVGVSVRYDPYQEGFYVTDYYTGRQIWRIKDNMGITNLNVICKDDLDRGDTVGRQVGNYYGANELTSQAVVCPTNTFVCGLQMASQNPVEDIYDNYAVTGLRILCCRSF